MANYTFYVTVSGGKFLIDGVSQQTVDLGHNLTYRFDQSDSSNGAGGTHPLRFSTTSDGTHGGGSEYTTEVTTNGTPGQSGAYTEIAVTSSTTNPLYYYCSNHSGMGGQANTTSAEFANTTGVALKKPILANATDKWGQFSNQNLDTIAGKLPQSFVFPTGTGENNQVILSNGSGGSSWGDVALTPEITGVTWYSDSGYSSALSTSEAINIDDATYLKVSGSNLGSSGVFGSSAYVQIINTTQSNAVVGNNQSGLTGCVTFASHQSDAEVRFTINPTGVSGISSGDTLKVKYVTNGGDSLFATGYVVSADPTSVTTVNSATISNTASVGSFGGTVTGGGEDSNTKLLLNFDRTGGTDIEDSSNTGGDGHKITAIGSAVIKASPFGDGKSAIFFDGTNDYLSIANSSDFNFGTPSGNTNDFTIEFWARIDAYNTQNSWGRRIFSTRDASFTEGFTFSLDATNEWIQVDFKAGTNVQIPGTTSLSSGWHHVALVRVGTVYTLYIDGVQDNQVTSSSALVDSNEALLIGAHSSGNGHFSGYLDSIRIVKGSAVYDSDFTVPTSRLTAITNTKLLIHSDSHGEKVNNTPTTLLGTSYFEGSGPSGLVQSSYRANGSNNGLEVIGKRSVANSLFDITTGDFTIDFWLKRNGDHSGGARIFSGFATDTFEGPVLYMNSSEQLLFYWDDGTGGAWNVRSGTLSEGAFTLTDNAWYHIGIVREGTGTNNVKLYIDAVVRHQQTANNTVYFPANNGGIQFGRDGNNGSYLDGNIMNFRVSNTSRYTNDAKGDLNNSGTIIKPSSTYTGSFTGTSGGLDQYTKCWVPCDNFIFDDSSTSDHTITATGSFHSHNHGGIAPALTWPTSLKKTGSAGVYFDGNEDYLTVFHGAFPYGSSARTFEAWVYLVSLNSSGYHYAWKTGSASSGLSWGLLFRNHIGNNDLNIVSQHHGSDYDITTNVLSSSILNTWTHFAQVYDGTNVRLYMNGKLIANSAKSINTTASDLIIGANSASASGSGPTKAFHGYIDGFKVSDAVEYSGTNSSSDWSNYLGSSGTTPWNQPTQIYGAFKSDTIDTITLTGSVGSGQSGYVTFNNATLSGQTETTSALPAGLSLNEAESTDNTATITGDLTALAGSHAINLVARVTSDGTDAEIDPNRKQAYSHTITKGSGGAPLLFNARRYHGSGVTGKDLKNYGFNPDFAWIKRRNGSAHGVLVDSVRGAGSALFSSSTQAVGSTPSINFINDGIELDTHGNVNANDGTYIAWAWKAGGVPSANGKKIVDGVESSITSGASADYETLTNVKQSINTAGDFSITQFTGSDSDGWFKHGLSGKPDWIIIKRLTPANSWGVWHSGFGGSGGTGEWILLDSNQQKGYWNDGTNGTTWDMFGTIDTTKINLIGGTSVNSPNAHICYAWKAVSGVSAFGTYTGGGSNGLSLQNIGFSPSLLIIKRTNGTGHWMIHDSKRGQSIRLYSDLSDAETDDTGTQEYYPTFESSGFSYPETVVHANYNTSGGTYIYIAFS